MNNFNHIAEEAACLQPTDQSKWGDTLACDETIKIRKVMFTNIHSPTVFKSVPMKVERIDSLDE